MKFTRFAIVAALALVSGRAYAFHAGGVAQCEGCHTMHNSTTAGAGTASTVMGNNPTIGQASAYLLQGQDPSSTCLICHGRAGVSSYHVYEPSLVTATTATFAASMVNFTPGGDFGWQANTGFGARNQRRFGHSVIAAAYAGMVADTRPGAPAGDAAGVYNGANFSCVSCHDPHSKARFDATGAQVTGLPIAESGSYPIGGALPAGTAMGAYRLLAGVGYQPKSSATQPAFTVAPPVAVAPSSYNSSELNTFNAGTRAGQVVVAYGSGMSEWCATCHPGMHNNTNTSGQIFKHPAGNTATMSATVAANYNTYLKSGDLTGSNAYDAIVPFEQHAADRASLEAEAVGVTGTPSITAVAGTSGVMCLSCHRAHASPYEFALRWADKEFIIEAGEYYGVEAGARGEWRSSAIIQAAHQNRPATAYSTFQKSLCNKCHAKD
ncbi:cytochrome C [Anaeromyxobacter sp. Red801]|uniref:cytochrome C n=1 Tax=Anaeromyxobacter sp. Red801 TaxID=3411632 RepID=UPI003BA0B91D